MALATIMGVKQKPQIGAIEISVSIREKHSQSADVQEFPIETGSNLADHRRVHPAELSMEGIISDAGLVSEARVNSDGTISRQPGNLQGLTIEEAYVQLLSLFENNDVFDVVTGLRVYNNMEFTSFEVTRENGKGAVLAFSANLRQLEFADSQTAALRPPPDVPQASNPINTGNKSTTPSTPEVRKSVFLKAGELVTKTPIDAVKNAAKFLHP